MNINKTNDLDSVHHIALQVADIDKAVKWYTTSFSCHVQIQTKTHALLEFSNIKLALSLPSQEPRHLAFLKEDANTYGQLREHLDGTFGTYVSDPTGNVVELISPKKPQE